MDQINFPSDTWLPLKTSWSEDRIFTEVISEQNGDDFVKIQTNFIFLLDTILTWHTSLDVRILMKAGNVKTTYLRSLDICQDQQLTIYIQKNFKSNVLTWI